MFIASCPGYIPIFQIIPCSQKIVVKINKTSNIKVQLFHLLQNQSWPSNHLRTRSPSSFLLSMALFTSWSEVLCWTLNIKHLLNLKMFATSNKFQYLGQIFSFYPNCIPWKNIKSQFSSLHYKLHSSWAYCQLAQVVLLKKKNQAAYVK